MNDLPEPGEPLKLANGKLIDPNNGNVIRPRKFVEVPTATQAQRIVAATRHRLADFPVPPKHLNAISVICFYTLLGIDERDIAIATGLTIDQINELRMSDVFSDIRQKLVDNIVEHDKDEVRTLFAKAAKGAANRVLDLMDNAEDEKVALAAANSALDRAGHRPVDIVEHRMRVDSSFKIEVIERKESHNVPVIDLEVEDGNRP